MNKLTITIEKIGDDYYSYIAEGGKGFGELRGCQNAEGIAKMIPIDLRSWIATQNGPSAGNHNAPVTKISAYVEGRYENPYSDPRQGAQAWDRG